MKILGEFKLKKGEVTHNEFMAIVVGEQLKDGTAIKIGRYYVAEMHRGSESEKWFLFDADFNAVLIGGSAFWFGDRQDAINQAVDFVKGDTTETLRKAWGKS